MRQSTGTTHPNGTTPVMPEQTHLLQVKGLHQRGQPRNVPVKDIQGGILWLLGKTTAQMIHSDDTITIAQAGNQMPPRKTPRRIPVHHQQWRTTALVNVMLHSIVGAKPARFERILLLKPGPPLRPLAQRLSNLVGRQNLCIQLTGP